MRKRCSQCGETKPLSEFYNHDGSKDGTYNQCKVCYQQNAKLHKAKPKHEASHHSEQVVIDELKCHGIYATAGKSSEWKRCDIVAWGCVKLEVKTAKQNEDGIFLFSTTHKQQVGGLVADLVVLSCIWKEETTFHIFPINHPVFYISGSMKRGFSYDPYNYHRKSGHGGRLTNALMNEHKDRWDLIENKRLEISVKFTGDEPIANDFISQYHSQLPLFEIG